MARPTRTPVQGGEHAQGTPKDCVDLDDGGTAATRVAGPSIAVEGFTDAAQFATLAHAARNTQVPFILLKHRVLTQGQSLEDAILASRPDLDARVEALRAKGEARADILSLTLNTAASN